MAKLFKSWWAWLAVTLAAAAASYWLTRPPEPAPAIVAEDAEEAVTAQGDVAEAKPAVEETESPMADGTSAAVNVAPGVSEDELLAPTKVEVEPPATGVTSERDEGGSLDVSGLATAPDTQGAEELPEDKLDQPGTIPMQELAEEEPEAAAPPEPLEIGPEVIEALNSPQVPDLPEAAAAGEPTAEMPPLLGDSSPPLSLAQILPPGEAPAPGQIAPSFDLVRVSPDGSAVIAGRAAPGANVQIFSGTVPVAEAVASERGEFVVFLSNPGEPTLTPNIPVAPEGAQLVVSQDDIVILPTLPEAEDTTPIVLRRTSDAVQIVQPSGPSIPSNVSLDLVSYTDGGAVKLSGRGRPGNIARVYADGALAGESEILPAGNWELEVPEMAEGRYLLRVDEIDAGGKVASRVESPFQRVFPEAQMPESFSQGAKIIVQPGNTLWLMATEAYGEGDAFTQIFSANKDAIKDPDLIYPGQIFTIPRSEE